MLRFLLPLTLLAAALFAGLAYFLRAQEVAAVEAARLLEAAPRPPATVTSALRSMKLVTVEIDTLVTVERGDISWRGDVAARVEVPVRISYGTDLSLLNAQALGYSALAGPMGGYIVRIPRPQRIATEVFSEQEQAHVEAGWMRLRSRAGEYYLGLARRDAAPAARELTLLPEDAARVERVTREQVDALVRSIVGKGPRIVVRFEDGP